MDKIEEILKPYVDLPLECDGLTKVLSYILTKNDIEHIVHEGYLNGPKDGIWHTWIELSNGYYIDYRARMWQGESDIIPHGIFKSRDYKDVKYSITKSFIFEVPETIFQILTYQPKNFNFS